MSTQAQELATRDSATPALVQPPRRSLIITMSARYGLEPSKFMAVIKATVMPRGNNAPEATDEQIAAFLAVANEYDLNPLIKEIYAFPSKGGGIVPIVGVDGWVTIVNRQPQMDGLEFTMGHVQEALKFVTCRIFRRDRSRAIEVTEYMNECKRNTDPWNQMPNRMLRHKALMQCARYAFGLSGIYDEDEGRDIAEGRLRVRTIGSVPVDHTPAESVSPILEMTEEETAQREKIHVLCQEIGYNTGAENMMIGQHHEDLPKLVSLLEAEKLEKTNKERAEIEKAKEKSAADKERREPEAESQHEAKSQKGKGGKGLF